MATQTETTDSQARVTLPQAFANTTVIVEQLNDTELLIRKAATDAPDEEPFLEESSRRLSNRDRDRFLELLDNPPRPNEALRRLMRPQNERHG
jgi:uncharacterized protein (DUF1778 family)